MESKKIKCWIFAIAAIALQIGAVAFILLCTQSIKKDAYENGRIILMECTARDPYNPFKGRYAKLTLVEENPHPSFTDVEGVKYKGKVYCTLRKDVDGIFRISAISSTMPEDGRVFIQASLNYSYKNESGETACELDFNFDEYYMQENHALHLDSLQTEDFNALNPRLELYVDKNGRCIQKELYLAGLPLADYMAVNVR